MEPPILVSTDLLYKMEALVQDLGSALDESSRSSVRRRWGLRRRARSTGNLPASCHKFHSDDSSSSMGGEIVLSRDKGLSSLQHSDSDEVSPNADQIATFSLRNRKVHQIGNFESDSFNENFSPVHPNTRRHKFINNQIKVKFHAYLRRSTWRPHGSITKRKFKRMAIDVTEMGAPSTSGILTGSAKAKAVIVPHSSVYKKKRSTIRHGVNCGFRYGSIICGKRKRSGRERSLELDANNKSNRALSLKLNQEERMDCTPLEPGIHCEIMSSSSLSSSESDTGIYTNDEGREGDDEQSDWFGGGDRKDWWDVSETDGDDTDSAIVPIGATNALQNLIPIKDDNRNTYRMQQFIKDGLSGREIRAGRRQVRVDRPGFSIVTSANEKLSRFLQDPAQSELRLHPMQPKERDQLCHLATLYSLDMTSDSNHPGLTCPVLTKTRNTTQAVRIELNRIQNRHLTEFKRRRKLPPSVGVIPQSHSAPGLGIP